MNGAATERRGTVISLCDLSGIMVKPWVEAGYRAVLVDPQHPEGINEHLLCACGYEFSAVAGKYGCPNCEGDNTPVGSIIKVGHVVDHPETWSLLRQIIPDAVAVFGFPVCTDVAVSGTSRWAEKRARDVHFQAKAMQLVHECRVIGELSGAPWAFENPVSAISSIYRKPDHTFHPADYGGYLPAGDEHPLYPEYFPPRDAYGKKTCIWSGGGFVMPEKRPVAINDNQKDGQGQSRAHNKLGGKSAKTKNIRSSTPRGFSAAVFLANAPHIVPANDNRPPEQGSLDV